MNKLNYLNSACGWLDWPKFWTGFRTIHTKTTPFKFSSWDWAAPLASDRPQVKQFALRLIKKSIKVLFRSRFSMRFMEGNKNISTKMKVKKLDITSVPTSYHFHFLQQKIQKSMTQTVPYHTMLIRTAWSTGSLQTEIEIYRENWNRGRRRKMLACVSYSHLW